MKHLVTDQPALFAGWVAHKVDMKCSWGSYYAMGIIDDQKKQIVAGVVFNNMNGANATCHIAAERTAGKGLIVLMQAAADYAFRQCKLKRLTGLVPVSEIKVIEFDKHLGWEEEFIIKDGAPDGDMMMLVMRPHKCRWLRGEWNGLESQ